MKFEVEINGTLLPQTYATEEEANQAAANARGQDWQKKIVVRDVDAPKPETLPAPTVPDVISVAPFFDATKKK